MNSRRTSTILVGVAVIIAAVMSAGCDERDGAKPIEPAAPNTSGGPIAADDEAKYHMVFVIPDDYTGVLRVRADEAATTEIRDGTTRIVFEDGVALVKSTAPFHEWHVTTAESPSGKAIPVEQVILEPPHDPDNRTLYGIGGNQHGTYLQFIGSEQALAELYKDESFLFER